MRIYPAIDIMQGECVRLTQGDFQQQTKYGTDPLKIAQAFEKQGARYLHVIDLDGAKNPHHRQSSIIQKITHETNLWVQVGGGIRSYRAAQNYLEAGVHRILLGSLALQDFSLSADIIRDFGPASVLLALDITPEDPSSTQQDLLHSKIAIQGWQEHTQTTLTEIIQHYLSYGLISVLCTDISKDGMLQGPNLALYEALQQSYPELEIMASGGVRSLEDLQKLKSLGTTSVVLGKALYEGKFSLKEALHVS